MKFCYLSHHFGDGMEKNMKKKLVLCILIIVLSLSACQGNNIEKSKESQNPMTQSYPFAKLEVKSVHDVTVSLIPPNKELKLNKNQTEHLVQLLKKVTSYKKVPSEELTGQIINCKIKTNKEEIIVQIINPIITIDGNSYKVSDDECEEINKYLNGLIS